LDDRAVRIIDWFQKVEASRSQPSTIGVNEIHLADFVGAALGEQQAGGDGRVGNHSKQGKGFDRKFYTITSIASFTLALLLSYKSLKGLGNGCCSIPWLLSEGILSGIAALLMRQALS